MGRGQDVELFLMAGVISAFVFFIGLFVGFSVGEQKISAVQEGINVLHQDIQEINLQFEVINVMNKSVSCDYMLSVADRLGSEATTLGKRLEQMEVEGKLLTSEYVQLKRSYMVVLINDWVVMERIKSHCESNMSTILYFYSNIHCGQCEEQAAVLNYYNSIMGPDLMIFALDTDVNMTVIEALVNTYNIGEYPSLIINGKFHQGYVPTAEMKESLCSFSRYSFC